MMVEYEDPLAAVKGCLTAVVVSVVLWWGIISMVRRIWQ